MDFSVGKIHWRRDRLPTPVLLGFSCGSAGKESTCSAGDPGSIPGQEDPLLKEKYPHQYCWASLVALLVKNLPAMREAWIQSLGWEGKGEGRRLEKGKATHSSILV